MTNKRENFKRIAENRVSKIIKMVALLGNLSNPSYYEYTPEQLDAIFAAIQAELDTQKKKLKNDAIKKRRFEL